MRGYKRNRHRLTHSSVVTMDSLKQLSWLKVKQVVTKEEKRTMKEIRKEMTEGKGKRKDERRIKKVEDVAKEIGWIDVIKDEWKLQMKKELWRDVHRDIVSTIM